MSTAPPEPTWATAAAVRATPAPAAPVRPQAKGSPGCGCLVALVAFAALAGMFGTRASRTAGPPAVREAPPFEPPSSRSGGSSDGFPSERPPAPDIVSLNCRHVTAGGGDSLLVSAVVRPGRLTRFRVVAKMRYTAGGRERSMALGERETTLYRAGRDGGDAQSYSWSQELTGGWINASAVDVVVYDVTGNVLASRSAPLPRVADD